MPPAAVMARRKGRQGRQSGSQVVRQAGRQSGSQAGRQASRFPVTGYHRCETNEKPFGRTRVRCPINLLETSRGSHGGVGGAEREGGRVRKGGWEGTGWRTDSRVGAFAQRISP